jgi:hypothetical protein
MRRTDRSVWLVGALVLLGGCQIDSRQQVLQTTNSQAAQRSISTRYFETGDRAAVFQGVLAALQDLSFVVDRADASLGTVSATRFDGGLTRFTVTVRDGAGERVIVRASGQVGQTELTEPQAFQRFFDSLEQALFLEANEIT